MVINQFKFYKGLQKPLVFKGLKGRFIYIGASVTILSAIIGLSIAILVNQILGVLSIGVFFMIGITIVFRKQKKGLYPIKKDKNTVYITPNKVKLITKNAQKKDI